MENQLLLNAIKRLTEENERITKERDELHRLLRSAMQAVEVADGITVSLREELEQVTRRDDEKYQLLLRLKEDVDRFGELVGVDVSETSLEEKVAGFNRTIGSLRFELAAAVEVLNKYADPATWFCNSINDEEYGGHMALSVLEAISKGKEQTNNV